VDITLYIISEMIAFVAFSGVALSILGASVRQIREIRRLSSLVRSTKPPVPDRAQTKYIAVLVNLEAIGDALSSGVAELERLEYPSAVTHWVQCEALRHGISDCVELPTGEEMSCCSRVSPSHHVSD
jgi:hypothetical protein